MGSCEPDSSVPPQDIFSNWLPPRQDASHNATTLGDDIMKKQISFIAPGQTAKALILVYLTFSVPIVLAGVLVAYIRFGSVELSTILSAMILNALIGFVLLWIACRAYNWVASRFGGIEIVLSDAPEEA
jgi:hypothetical protein